MASRLGLEEDHGQVEADGQKKKISENVSDYNQVFTKAGPPAASPLGTF